MYAADENGLNYPAVICGFKPARWDWRSFANGVAWGMGAGITGTVMLLAWCKML